MTTMEIAAEHGVSRQSIHTYRRTGAFPQPVEGEGSTRPRFRADEVAAFFAANPKQPGVKRNPQPKQQGEPVTTADPRLALMSRLNDPPYDGPSGKYCTPMGEAAQLLDAYRAAGLRDFLWRLEQSAGDAVAAKLVEDNPDLSELLNATETETTDG